MTDEQKTALVLSYQAVNKANGQLSQLKNVLTYSQYQGLNYQLTTINDELSKLLGVSTEITSESANANTNNFNPFKVPASEANDETYVGQNANATDTSNARNSILPNDLITSSTASSANVEFDNISSNEINNLVDDLNGYNNQELNNETDDDEFDFDGNNSNSDNMVKSEVSAQSSSVANQVASDAVSNVSQATSTVNSAESKTDKSLEAKLKGSDDDASGFNDIEGSVHKSFGLNSDEDVSLPRGFKADTTTASNASPSNDDNQTTNFPSLDDRVKSLLLPVSSKVESLRNLLVNGKVNPSEIKKDGQYEFGPDDLKVIKMFDVLTRDFDFKSLGDNDATRTLLDEFDKNQVDDNPIDVENYNCNVCLSDWLANNADSNIAKMVSQNDANSETSADNDKTSNEDTSNDKNDDNETKYNANSANNDADSNNGDAKLFE